MIDEFTQYELYCYQTECFVELAASTTGSSLAYENWINSNRSLSHVNNMSVALFVIILPKDERASYTDLGQDEILVTNDVWLESLETETSNEQVEPEIADDKTGQTTIAVETPSEVEHDVVQADSCDNDNLIKVQNEKINICTLQEKSVADEVNETTSNLGTKSIFSDDSTCKTMLKRPSKNNNDDILHRTEIMTPPPTDDFIEKIPVLDVRKDCLHHQVPCIDMIY